MKLNELRDNPGARTSRKRLGRGIGSGLGKTSGKGHKGAKRAHQQHQAALLRGRPDAALSAPAEARLQQPTPRRLRRGQSRPAAAGDRCRHGSTPASRSTPRRWSRPAWCAASLAGIRLLGQGELKAAVTIEVAGASKGAVAAVEQAGGKVVVLGAAGGSLSLPAPAQERRMASVAEQLAANINFGAFAKATELKKRLWFTLGCLIVYRLGTYIPLPGIDPRGHGADLPAAARRHPRHVQHVLGRCARSACRSSRSTSCRTSPPRSSCS